MCHLSPHSLAIWKGGKATAQAGEGPFASQRRQSPILFYFVVVELCGGDIIAAINTLPSTKIGLKIALRVSAF